MLLLLITFGCAQIPQMYIFSYVFKVSATGFAAMTAWNVLSSNFFSFFIKEKKDILKKNNPKIL